MARGWRQTWRAAVNLLLPPGCAFCDADLEPRDGKPLFCETCVKRLAPDTWQICLGCGTLADEPSAATQSADAEGLLPPASCLRCWKQPYWFDGVVPLGHYRDDLREAVLRMKRPIGDHLAAAMGELLARRRGAQLAAFETDVVVSIPMHWWRRMLRGTNSPEILASCVSRHLGVPFEPKMLNRRNNTRPQEGLSATKRFENVRGAFRLGRGYDIKGARVLLIDDIMTTGATCSEASKVLKKAGAEKVFVAVAARTAFGNG